jgi:hypothetical protein
MNFKIVIFSIILFLTSIVGYSQFFVDVYYGYNHSNVEYNRPNDFINGLYYYNDQIFYGDTPIDTITLIHGIDTTFIVKYNIRHSTHELEPLSHNFTKDQFYGISINYKYSQFFETGVSFERNCLVNKYSSIKTFQIVERYDYNDVMFYSQRARHDLNYKVTNLSLTHTISYPYKKFAFFVSVGLKGFYAVLNHDFTYSGMSKENELYEHYSDYSESSVYSRKYSGFSVGHFGHLGVSYQVLHNVSFFCKFGYTWANLNFEKGEQLNYYNEYTNSLNETTLESITEPETLAPERIPFSEINYNSWNYRFGIRYTFGFPKNANTND